MEKRRIDKEGLELCRLLCFYIQKVFIQNDLNKTDLNKTDLNKGYNDSVFS